MNVQTLKGFRDFLPEEAKKRQYAVGTLKKMFELYGFEPLETPALEYEEILLGKYGNEGDKLMYRFTDNGDRKVALRYDQTVPLARVVAQYENELPIPFKRYQIQPVWRAENTQKGRFREFLQCDCDIVGSSSPLSDAEVIATVAKSLQKLGFQNFKILINDRNVFSMMVKRGVIEEKDIGSVIRTLDKLKKVGREGVLNELMEKGLGSEKATYLLQTIERVKPTERIEKILSLLANLGVSPLNIEFSPTLARGLDYYTSTIFEIEIEGYTTGSVCGGGRYDNLIGMFSDKQIPAVGFSFGFDRLVEAMKELKLFPDNLETTQVLVTVFSKELVNNSLEVVSQLRLKSIKTDIYPDENTSFDKQLKYADKKQIPYVVMIGDEEAKNATVTIKNMKTREQKTVSQTNLPNEFR